MKKVIILGQGTTGKKLAEQCAVQNVVNSAYREHCEFKDAPCNYTGRGWYDRCAWCKDNNGFKRKTDDSSKPF